MNDLEDRLAVAKQDSKELERLLCDCLPFIKKQLGNLSGLGLAFDDMYSIALMVFANCVRQYTKGKGRFLSFVQVSIKNRILDESRKEQKYASKIIPLEIDYETDSAGDSASLQLYSKELERQCISDELEGFSNELLPFHIVFSELPKLCPKQERARQLCIRLAQAIVKNSEMKAEFLQSKRVPQSRLANEFKISPKTIEKHRKYIVTLVVLFLGDYPNIKSFLMIKDKDESH